MEDFDFELKNITLMKGGVAILDDISLKIPSGTITAVMGASGSGKTTLLKMIAGLIPPDRGSVLFRGKNIFSLTNKENENFRRSMGFVFQDAALWANKTIYSNLFIPIKYHFPKMINSDIEKQINLRLEDAGMLSDKNLRPSQLSTGEQKIISYIRGTINDPGILFLDNPLLSLDHEVSSVIQKQIKQRCRREDTIIISSQDHLFLSMITQYLIIIEKGKILADNTVEELMKSENPRIKMILQKFLGESAVYDQNILEILDEDGTSDLFS